MKKNLIFGAFISLSLLVACAPKTEQAQTTDSTAVVTTTTTEVAASPTMTDGKYTLVTETSTLKWLGKKVGGQHNGKVGISGGSFDWAGGNITSGNFSIDFNTIVVEDLPTTDENNAKLTGHLKSADFFDAANTPTGTFNITKVEAITTGEGTHKITGDLTMKGKTNAIEFPATITPTAEGANIKAKIVIDRTKWGVNFKSKTVYKLADKFINDEVELELDVNTKK
jgi:polyisoprenoid-binding protein YceI